MLDSAFCFVHNPATAARRHLARSQGGKAREGRVIVGLVGDLPPAALQTPGDLLCILEYACGVALALERSYRQVNALVSIVTAAAKILEIGDLEVRLQVLEAQVFNTPDNGRYMERVSHGKSPNAVR